METKLNAKQQKLWKLVQQINNCWFEGNPTDLSDFFHDEVVFNSPDFFHQITGKANCVQTYREFLDRSTVQQYNSGNPNVTLLENTAVVTYDFEMKYQQSNKKHHETGTDIVVFKKIDNTWKVIWRGLSNLKNKAEE